jgi:hypothetical protein
MVRFFSLPLPMLPITSTDTFKISCDACGARVTVKKADEGKKTKCPKCRSVLICKPQTEASPPASTKAESPPAAPLQTDAKSASTAYPAPASIPPATSIDSREWGTAISKKAPAPLKAAAAASDDEETPRASSLVIWGGGGVAAVLVIVGCYYLFAFIISFFAAPPVGTISGKVYFDDTPVKSGIVAFFPKKGEPIQCSIQPDGTYEAKGVEYGDLIVTVMQKNPKFKDGFTRRMEAKKAGKRHDEVVDDGEKMHLLPEIYADSQTSPLRFTLDKSIATNEIRLSDE